MKHRCSYWFLFIVLLFAGGFVPCRAQLNTDRITAIGRNALYFEDYVLSIQYFNQVIKLKPYLAEPFLLRAIAKIQLQDYTGALGDCNSSIERNPFHPGAFYTRGYVWRQMGEYAKAEQDFTQALVFSPDNKSYMMLRADVLSQQKKWEQALKDMDYLLGREPTSPAFLFEKGVICLNMKDTACAYDYLSRNVRYDSQNAAAWSALGLVDIYLDRDSAAMADLTRAINLGSKWAGDYINRGILSYRLHNYRGALSDYDEAVRLAPEDASCYYNRGLLRAEVGDYNRALEDLDKAVELRPEDTEMRYQRSVVLMELGQWQSAISDLDTMIAVYPYFLPSYYLAAQAKTALGEKQAAYGYRKTAYDLEQKKDSVMAARKDSISAPNTDVHLAKASPDRRNRRKEFSTRTAQNGEDTPDGQTAYSSETRGAVQKRYADVVNEQNIALSYYVTKQPARRTNYTHASLDRFNRKHILPSVLHATCQELTLTAEMVNSHFDNISQLSRQLATTPDPYTYFARATEFALVQDYASAIDDCTAALTILQTQKDDNAVVIITFCRANWRYRLIEYRIANGELQNGYKGQSVGGKAEMDFDIMLRDYDYVLRLQPDFAFAFYNKANILCQQKDYDAAILHYTKAIACDTDFAEAYFNRGLTYIYTDRVEEGLSDLSKAGELGIYQAYNLITRFQ
ncbi:MAG: tetratricopeptide repeat protein [Paludibacteraceae bacterium]|nr:tetratricopeptide repeat protein [Paludibacteraceae bacterium]